ncbi:MAG: serine/threonine protein kinase [Idiomarina sp.]|nr:serine/threonine protein kinase [Idiomarina sp.]
MSHEPPFSDYDDEPTMVPGEPQSASAQHKFPYPISPRYRCLGLLGQGSSGAVYKAFDSQLLREVAIKFIHRHEHEERARLLNEARVLAQLEHPNICKVFEVAEEGQAVYLVMSYVNGPHLNQWREQFSQNQLISMIADVAGALHTAHQKGIVHCDIKPSNIVLRQSSKAVQAVLVDFGIAHATRSSASITGAGTEHYMAPERISQQAGSAQALAPAIDIYALGATLRFVLTGSHAGSLKTLNDDLKRIIEHCLADKANERYADAETLQQDLIAYLNHRPISLRHSPIYKTKRLWQRSRWFRGTSSAALALAVIAIIGVNFYQNTMSQRQLEQLNISEQVVQREYQIESIYRSPRHPVHHELEQLGSDAERWYLQADEHAEWLAAAHYAAAGRLFYQLYDNQRAFTSLQRAWDLNDRSDRTATTFALTLNRYYFDARRQARALPSAEARQAANQQAYETYALRALQVLEQVELVQLPRDYVQAMRLYFANQPLQALSLLQRGNFPHWFYQRYELMLEISDELTQDILDEYTEGDYLALIAIHEHAFNELVNRVPSYLPAYVLRANTLFSLQTSRENEHDQYDDSANSWLGSLPELLSAMAEVDNTHPDYLATSARYDTLLSFRSHLTDNDSAFHLSRGTRFFEQSLRHSAARNWPSARTTGIIRGALNHYQHYINHRNNQSESSANLLARYQVILDTLPEVYRGSDYYMSLGNAYRSQARFASTYAERDLQFSLADQAYADALQRAPDSLGLQANYAAMLNTWSGGLPLEKAMEVRGRAIDLITPVVQRMPDNIAVQYNYGSLHKEQAIDLGQAGDEQTAAELLEIADAAYAKTVELAPQLDIARQRWSDIYLYFNDYLTHPLSDEAREGKVLEILSLDTHSMERSPMSFVREVVLLLQRYEATGEPQKLAELEDAILANMIDSSGLVYSADIARTLVYMSVYTDENEKSQHWRELAQKFFAKAGAAEHTLFEVNDNASILMAKFADVLGTQSETDQQVALERLKSACEISHQMYEQGYLKYIFLEDTAQAWRTIEQHTGVACAPDTLTDI